MHSLRQIVQDHQTVDRRNLTKSAGDRRLHQDRRSADRRHNVYPLESRDARLRFAAQAAGFGTYDLDCLTGDSIFSPELREIAGLPPSSEPLSTEEMESMIHPDDSPGFMERLRESLAPEGSGGFEAEFRFRRPDGGVRWVLAKGRTFFTGNGQGRHPIAATGVMMDITARRAAERALAESREELDKLVGSAIDGIVTINADQRIIRFNPSAARTFGYSIQEALDSPVEQFMPERFREKHAEHVRQFAQSGSPAKSLDSPKRFAGLRKNGEEFPFEATVTRVSVDGQTRMTMFLRDISDRVRAEEALQRHKQELELAVKGADIGIWNWDLRSGHVELSDRCRQLFGIPPGEALDFQRVLASIHPADRARVVKRLRRALDKGEEYRYEKRVVWPDGSLHWLSCIGRNLHDEEASQAVGIRGISIDITERKEAEEALAREREARQEMLTLEVAERTAEVARANEALMRSNLELQQFAFIAAHDMQTPLRSIAGFAQLLQKDFHGRLGPAADSWLDQLVRSTHRMRDVINDVLAYSRVESRGSAFQPVDFNRLFDDVAATLDAPIRENGAQVLRGDLPTVEGDRTQLAQVLQNLIENAIKYRGDEPPQIYVSAGRQGEEWLFSVRDNGMGIADRHLESIFEIFRRLHTQQEFPGTGIGLAICRRVIHRHGGRIWAESEPGQGSTFYFTLPEKQ